MVCPRARSFRKSEFQCESVLRLGLKRGYESQPLISTKQYMLDLKTNAVSGDLISGSNVVSQPWPGSSQV